MNPKLLRRCLTVAVTISAVIGIYYYQHAPLVRVRLQDGTEIRVLKVAYGNNAHHEHELVSPSQLKSHLVRLLPQRWQDYFSAQASAPPYLQTLYHSDPPPSVISIWWIYNLRDASPSRPRLASPAHIVVNNGNETQLYYDLDGGNIALRGSAGLGPEDFLLRAEDPHCFVFEAPPGPAKTVMVRFTVNGEPVTFAVPIPHPANSSRPSAP